MLILLSDFEIQTLVLMLARKHVTQLPTEPTPRASERINFSKYLITEECLTEQALCRDLLFVCFSLPPGLTGSRSLACLVHTAQNYAWLDKLALNGKTCRSYETGVEKVLHGLPR